MENKTLVDRIMSVEQDIAQTLFDVQLKSDQRVAETLGDGDARFKERCSLCVLQYNEKLAQAKTALHQEYLDKIQAYHDELRSIKTNREAFSSLLDRLLFVQ